MMTTQRLSALFALAFLALAVRAEVYQWRDADGNMVFGDRPPRDQVGGLNRIRESSLQSSAAAAAEEAVFRERQRRLLQAMARDRAEREKLRKETAQQNGGRVSRAERCTAVRHELSEMEVRQQEVTAAEVPDNASLREFLARHCGGDG